MPPHDPGDAAIDTGLTALVRAVRRTPERYADAPAVAAAAGLSPRRFDQLLLHHYHATAKRLLLDARMARARRLILGRKLTERQVGAATGFADHAAFGRAFARDHGMTPRAYRRMLTAASFVLRLPDDFAVGSTWRYLGRDAENTTERVSGRRVWRALRHRRSQVIAELQQVGGRVAVRVRGRMTSSPLAMASYHRQIWRWLGLDSPTAAFERKARRQRGWAALLRRQRGLRLPFTPTVFEALVWAIVGQQVNLAFAYRLRRVVVELCGPATSDGLRGHPTPAEVARLDYADLTRRQFSRRKAEYLIDTARLAAGRRGGFETWLTQPATEVATELRALRGVGEWTEQYVLMRGCGFADCVPVGDAGLVKALRHFHGLAERPDAEATRRLMEPLAPHRSLATAHLWASLYDDGPPA